MKTFFISLLVVCLLALGWTYRHRIIFSPNHPVPGIHLSAEELAKIYALSPYVQPGPDETNRYSQDPKAAVFGQRLYYDTRLSGDKETSCATCHDPNQGWSVTQSFPEGFDIDFHPPTLFNVANNRWYFWDGRTDSLWSQALQPLEHPKEQNISRLEIVHLLQNNEDLKSEYESVFGPLPDFSDAERFPDKGRPVPDQEDDPMHQSWSAMSPEDQKMVNQTFANIGKAIAAFEEKIVAGPAPFDDFVEGLKTGNRDLVNQISTDAMKGLKLFVGKAKCRDCHHGPNFSDKEFHNIRVAPVKGEPTEGRLIGSEKIHNDPFNGLGDYSDKTDGVAKTKLRYLDISPHNLGELKTPSLRNIVKTPPYMHQGQFNNLLEVINHYSTMEGALELNHEHKELMVPLNLTEEEILHLIAFLQSLTEKETDESLHKP